VLVSVHIKSLDGGKIQICVSRPQAKGDSGQTYQSFVHAREALLALGIDEKEIEETLQLLSDVGHDRPLHFLVRDIPQKVLSDNGFKL
jgi:hypothetical protein